MHVRLANNVNSCSSSERVQAGVGHQGTGRVFLFRPEISPSATFQITNYVGLRLGFVLGLGLMLG